MRWLVLVLVSLTASYVSAAGFDCSKATTFAESSVCSNADLSQLDEILSRAYRMVAKSATGREKLKETQRT